MNKSISILFLVLCFPVICYSQICTETTVLDFVKGGPCPSEAPTAPPEWIIPSGGNCTVSGLSDWGNCTATYTVCCDDTVPVYENSIHAKQQITGVTFGQETTALNTAYQSWFDQAPSVACSPAHQATGFMAGAVYDSVYDSDTGTVTLNAGFYKRTVCSRAGVNSPEIVPIGNLQSGGSGGTVEIDYTQMSTSVKAGLDSSTALADQLLKLGEIKTAVEGIPGGSGGGGLSLADTTLAVKSGTQQAFQGVGGSLAVTPSSAASQQVYGNSGLPLSETINFQNRFTTFFNDMKQTPLFSNFGLAELGNVSGGTSTMPLNFGSYGTVDFNLDNYSGVFGAIKGIVLLLGSYLSVRAVTMKR